MRHGRTVTQPPAGSGTSPSRRPRMLPTESPSRQMSSCVARARYVNGSRRNGELGSTFYPKQTLAHHREVRHLRENQPCCCRWVAPRGTGPHTRHQPRASVWQLIKSPRPGGAPDPSIPPEHPSVGFECFDPQPTFATGPQGDEVSNGDVLEIGKDALRAAATEVIKQVVAVPAGPTETDLDQPRPDGLWGRVDGNAPRRIEYRRSHNVISRHDRADLLAGGSPGALPRAVQGQEDHGKRGHDDCNTTADPSSATPSSASLVYESGAYWLSTRSPHPVHYRRAMASSAIRPAYDGRWPPVRLGL